MSTIGSGIPGFVQTDAPASGKAVSGKAGEASEKGAFAQTVASLQPKEGESGRLSIIDDGERDGKPADGARARRGQRDIVRALVDASGAQKASADAKAGAPEDGKDAMPAENAGRVRRKLPGEGRDGADAVAGKEEREAEPDAPAADDTGAGRLLDLLTARGAAAMAGVAQGGGSKSPQRTEGDGGDAPQSETDQLFRLVRADGKGRDLDMSLGRESASFRDADPMMPKGETVTVVDARRYIGLAEAGNAAAVTGAIAQDPEWAASLSATGGLTHSEAAATGKVVNTLKIQMHPIELGLVTATLRLHGDELVVSLQVQTGEAYRQLTDDQDAIVRALRGQGFAVDQVSVQLAPADRSANAQDDRGQQGQQQFAGQPQGGDGRGPRDNGGTGAFGREGGAYEGNTSETAPGPAGGQPVRSGGVYL